MKDNLVPRGIILPLGDDVYACFDTDLLRIACVWQAEPGKQPIDYQSVATLSYENTNKKAGGGQKTVSKPLGKPILATSLYPGIQYKENILDTDPRKVGFEKDEIGRGPFGNFLGIIDHGLGELPSLRYGLGEAIVRERIEWKNGNLKRSVFWEKPDAGVLIVPMGFGIERIEKKKAAAIVQRQLRWPDIYKTAIQLGEVTFPMPSIKSLSLTLSERCALRESLSQNRARLSW